MQRKVFALLAIIVGTFAAISGESALDMSNVRGLNVQIGGGFLCASGIVLIVAELVKRLKQRKG